MKLSKIGFWLILVMLAYWAGTYRANPAGVEEMLLGWRGERPKTQQVAPKDEPVAVVGDDVTGIPVEMALWQEMKSEPKTEVGEPTAPVTMVVFSDGKCETCEQYQKETWPKIVQNYVETGKLRVWQFPFVKKGGKKGEIDALAKAAGVLVEPTFFVAQYRIEGAQPYVTFESLIEKALAEAK